MLILVHSLSPYKLIDKILHLVQFDGINSRQFNSLPLNKIVHLSKLKAFADDKFNVTKIMIYVSDLLKIWEKEKMLVTSNLSFSHNVFKRLFFFQDC